MPTDLTPTPGVWYRDGDIPEGQGPHLLYCPDGPDDSLPWMVGVGREWLTRDKAPKNLVEVYNPHPPQYTDPQWRSGTLRGVVEDTWPIFDQFHARGARNATKLDLVLAITDIQDVIGHHRIAAGIERPDIHAKGAPTRRKAPND